ncbi:alpha/beta hydrolase [Nocardia arizonensis]|uniref:alpha/beta hydrolase n=1 Tax=Nocardia arizonensis TaxID=1141647 RepID=UPI0007A73412|nr:alpha/beta hydrolase family protein [Nocardia arizonensis]
MIRTSHRARLLLVALSIMVAAASAPASAQTSVTLPPAAAPDGSYLEDVSADGRGFLDVGVFSTAMNTTITVKILPAHDTTRPAPTLYLLNGASGGDAGSSWFEQTDITTFFADKHVNIVIPLGGAGSYFTDWHNPDPTLGHPAWTTFLTRELPPIIDTALHTTTVNAIAGISMAATSVFQLAIAAPGLYKAIGSYSGCVRTSDPLGHAMVTAVVARWNGNATNMWGPPTDPAWTDNDPYLNADKLRGTTIYISTGTGIPGRFDAPDSPGIDGDPNKWVDRLTVGGGVEAATLYCVHTFGERLAQLNIPARVVIRPTGTHSWKYWQGDLHESWEMIGPVIGA